MTGGSLVARYAALVQFAAGCEALVAAFGEEAMGDSGLLSMAATARGAALMIGQAIEQETTR